MAGTGATDLYSKPDLSWQNSNTSIGPLAAAGFVDATVLQFGPFNETRAISRIGGVMTTKPSVQCRARISRRARAVTPANAVTAAEDVTDYVDLNAQTNDVPFQWTIQTDNNLLSPGETLVVELQGSDASTNLAGLHMNIEHRPWKNQ